MAKLDTTIYVTDPQDRKVRIAINWIAPLPDAQFRVQGRTYKGDFTRVMELEDLGDALREQYDNLERKVRAGTLSDDAVKQELSEISYLIAQHQL